MKYFLTEKGPKTINSSNLYSDNDQASMDNTEEVMTKPYCHSSIFLWMIQFMSTKQSLEKNIHTLLTYFLDSGIYIHQQPS